MRSHPRYSPDGTWWWDGSAWRPATEIGDRQKPAYVPPPPPPVAPPPLHPPKMPRWVGVVAVMTVVLLAVGGVFFAARGLGSAEAPPGVQDRPATSLVGALRARGLDCSQVPNAGPTPIWACLEDTSPSYEYVVAQYGADGHLDHLEAKVDRLGLNPGGYNSRGQANTLYQTIVESSFQPTQGQPLLRWVRSAVGSGGGRTTQGGLALDVSTYRGDLVKLALGVRGQSRAALGQPLPRVTSGQGQALLEGAGYACRQETGFLYCELDRPALYGDGSFFHDTGAAVTGINLLVHAQGDAAQDVTPQVNEWFPAVIGLVLQGDDANRAGRWVTDHLGKSWHMAVVGGVKLQMYGFRPEAWGPTGIWGMRIEIAPADWP